MVKEMLKIRKLENMKVQQLPLKEFVVSLELLYKTPSMPGFARVVRCIGQLVSMSCKSGRFEPTFSLACFSLPDGLKVPVDADQPLRYLGLELDYVRSGLVEVTGSLQSSREKFPPARRGRYYIPTEQEILLDLIQPLLVFQETGRVLPAGVRCNFNKQ